MAGSPRIVTRDTGFRWDGAVQRLTRGTVLDVPPDSQLEDAIGAENLAPLGPLAAQDDEGGQDEAPDGKPRRKADDEGDGK